MQEVANPVLLSQACTTPGMRQLVQGFWPSDDKFVPHGEHAPEASPNPLALLGEGAKKKNQRGGIGWQKKKLQMKVSVCYEIILV